MRFDNSSKRLAILALSILLINHVLASIMVVIAKDHEGVGEMNWLRKYNPDYEDWSNFAVYQTAFYFISVTITTVGYGDISPSNTLERLICNFVLFVGVITFSIAAGSLSSILTNYDAMQHGYQEKMQTLEHI
jgi:voltage-gated potassium channel Kch